MKYELATDNEQGASEGSKSDSTLAEYITIATQRPETIMGDTAICVHPNDERFTHLKGKYAIVPLINRRIPIIFDEYVDPMFGTGALKVTPAHDINDYNLGLKHNLEVVDTLNEDGTLSEAAQIYIGVERFAARKKILVELKEKNYLIKEEEYASRLGYSQRSGVVVEPRISTQWFLKMKEMAEPALKAVLDGEISIHPGEKFLATYKYWLENVKDWCISRQLWWGQQIPAWYDDKGNLFVAENEEEAVKQCASSYGQAGENTPPTPLTRDADVLDTWFSSWLWPMEVFNGISQPGNQDFKYYYPTAVLVTGQDIIFFWVARMIMAGMHYQQVKPFSDVYFTGMVRDNQGRKMSKSLGNSPDLLDLIEKYGADAVRFGIMISSPAGNDLLFDETSLEQGRNFNNKIWNALKLVQMWQGRQMTEEIKEIIDDNFELTDETKQLFGEIEHLPNETQLEHSNFSIAWFANRLQQVRAEVEILYSQFRLSEALKVIYSLIWDDFCSWYLEWVKPGFEQPIEDEVYARTVGFFEDLMQLLHPFMPFVTEEIYHLLGEKQDDLCIKQFPVAKATNGEVLASGELLKQVISALRDARNKSRLKPKETIKLFIQSESSGVYTHIENILQKQVNAESIEYVHDTVQNSTVVAFEKDRFYIESEKKADTDAIKTELLKDLEHQQGFLQSVVKKLSNERFVANAKSDVVDLEKKKQADAEARIQTIQDSLANLA